jgi:hypothetical protein
MMWAKGDVVGYIPVNYHLIESSTDAGTLDSFALGNGDASVYLAR